MAPASLAAGGEISVFGTYLSGDYGEELSNSEQALTLRFLTGSDLQFRADVSFLRVETNLGTIRTGMGPVPGGSGGPGDGEGGNGTSGGNGMGIGSPAAQQGGGPPAADETGWNTGVGDVRVGLGKRLLGGGAKLFRSDAVAEVKAPTADADSGLGTGEWDARLGLTGEYRFWSATAFGGATWNWLGDPEWIELKDALDLFAGAESEPLAGERLILSGWIEAHQEVVEGAGARGAIGLGLRSARGTRWRVTAAADVLGEYRQVYVLVGLSFGVSSAGPGIRGVER